VEETLALGASVARVARAHGINANQVFHWRRLYQRGLLGGKVQRPVGLLSVTVLDEYIAAVGISGDPDGPLFRTAAGKTGALTGNGMWQQDAPTG
jgi:transposase